MTVESIDRIPLDWPHRQFSRSIAISGLQWHVQVAGAGPAILLLHGTGSSAHSFCDLLPFLTDHATVIVPDLPGHGFTRGAHVSSLTLPAIAGALDALLQALGVSEVALVAGHSAGAPLAMRWAISQTIPPAALVGFNPALIAPPRGYTQLVAPIIVPFATSSVVAGVLAHLGAATGMVDKLLTSTRSVVSAAQRQRYAVLFRNPDHVRGAMGLMAAADLPALLKDARTLLTPMHFVLGDRDDWVPSARLVRIIKANFASAATEVWPGGHLLHEADPARAARLLLDQLATLKSERSIDAAV